MLNFLNKQNFADVRMLELINKRVLQFDGIMGMSDDVIGNFTDNAADGMVAAFEQVQHKKDIETEHQATLSTYEEQNTDAVQAAENALFTTFTRDVADKVTITPQHIKDRTAELNVKLWELTSLLLEENGYIVNHEDQTAILPDDVEPPQLFYYWTGTHNKSYTGLRVYGAKPAFKPVSGRVTLASPIGRGVLHNVECADEGTITAKGVPECKLAFYAVTVSKKGASTVYNVFAGKTADQPLSDEDCRSIMALSALSFTEEGRRAPAWLKRSTGRSNTHELDSLLDLNIFKDRAVWDMSDARREEVAAIAERARREKSLLNREVESLKNELRQIENALLRTDSVADRVDAEKKKAAVSKILKSREQSLFMDGLRIDADAEAAVQTIADNANLTVVATRLFMINMGDWL